MLILEKFLKVIFGLIIIISLISGLNYLAKNWTPAYTFAELCLSVFQSNSIELIEKISIRRPEGWSLSKTSDKAAKLKPSLHNLNIDKVEIKVFRLSELSIEGSLTPQAITNALYQTRVTELKNSYNPLITDNHIEYYLNFNEDSVEAFESTYQTWIDSVRINSVDKQAWRILYLVREDLILYLEFFYLYKTEAISHKILKDLTDSISFIENSLE
ncbi:MAG: hypothetical protein R3A13_06100 [Bdellovibrionota bacterium]